MDYSKLNILPASDSALKAKCGEVVLYDTDLRNLTTRMIGVATENQLVGLASSQLGILQCVFIVDMNSGNMDNPDLEPSFKVFVNPKVKGNKNKGRSWAWEGCGSLVGWRFLVERWDEVNIEAQNIYGETFQMTLKGFLARVAQHENDHLNGILVTEKARQREKVK